MDDRCFGCGIANPGGLGIEFEVDGQVVVGRFEPRTEHQGAPGYLHGGVTAAVLDEAMANVSWLLDGVESITATMKVRYRQPVTLPQPVIVVEAWTERPRTERYEVLARLQLEDGSTPVDAVAIFVNAPGRVPHRSALGRVIGPAMRSGRPTHH